MVDCCNFMTKEGMPVSGMNFVCSKDLKILNLGVLKSGPRSAKTSE